jgi:valyl-tRNA synthetase
MRLLHPFCPFISEEIWQKLPNIQGKCKSTSFCAASSFPKEKSFFIDNKASFFMNIVISAVSMIRSLRQGIGLSAKKKVRAIFFVDTKFEKQKLENQKNAIKRVANIIVLSIKIKGTKVQEGNTITLTDEKIRVIISLKDILNTESEIIRIKREIKKISYLRLKMEKRINNIGFMNRASLNIIKETKQKYKNLKKKEKYLIKVISNL